MAQRRMFSTEIVASDAFLDMSVSARELYFQLGMYADDDGFVNPKRIIRMVGASDDDLRILMAKRFVLTFESGVIVIKHWLHNNLIRADLYKETAYKKEKAELGLNENGSYTELRKGVSGIKTIEAPKWLKIRRGETVTVKERYASGTETGNRIGKVRIGKVSKGKDILERESKHILTSNSFIEDLKKQFPDIEVGEEIEKMKDWLAANGRVKKDYKAFARNWLRNTKPKAMIKESDEVIIRPERNR